MLPNDHAVLADVYPSPIMRATDAAAAAEAGDANKLRTQYNLHMARVRRRIRHPRRYAVRFRRDFTTVGEDILVVFSS